MGSILSSQRHSSSTDQRTQSNDRNTTRNNDIYPAEVVGVVNETTERAGVGGVEVEELRAEKAVAVGHRGSLLATTTSTLNKKSTDIAAEKKVSRRTKRYAVCVCV